MTVSTEITITDLELRATEDVVVEPGLTQTVETTIYDVVAADEVIGQLAERFSHRHRSKSGQRTWYQLKADGSVDSDTLMTTRSGAMNELLKRLA